MGHILHPLFALLASGTRQDLARQVAYLKEENRILRARLPQHIVMTERERTALQRRTAAFSEKSLAAGFHATCRPDHRNPAARHRLHNPARRAAAVVRTTGCVIRCE